jgi:outer membrane protein, heavy metal efflux system
VQIAHPIDDSEDFMLFDTYFRHCIAAVVTLSCASVALAQNAVTPADLKRWALTELYAQAWANDPTAKLGEAIDAEANAKLERAQSWLAGPPSLDAGIRTDAITRSSRREGLREIEFEVAAPIATSARRSLHSATAMAEAHAQHAAIETQRLKLAGEVREAYWSARSAESDVRLAREEAARARALADDSARRTRAGDSARVDTLQAEANAQQAANAVIEAQGKLDAALATLMQLVGATPGDPRSATVMAVGESRERRPAAPRGTQAQNTTHAALAQARATIAAARARLDEVNRLTSEPPTVKFTLANERTNEGGSKSSARIGVSIPFDAAFRFGNFNAPRAAQATRELAELDGAARAAERSVFGEVRAAELALATAEARVPLAKRRAEFAVEAAALYEKAYRLGELDLPTRLRSEGERANAVRDAARAELEVEHAISRLQQALGNLP